MKFLIYYLLYLPFSKCFISKVINDLRNKIVVKSNKFYTEESFYGVWNLKRDDNKTEIINICPNGKIENPSNLGRITDGIWYIKKNDITIVTFDFNSHVNEILYGKINKENINIKGTISYGSLSPDYVCNFEMKPIFPIFHNISFQNNTSNKQTFNLNNITGKWLIENINTGSIHILIIYENYTWHSINNDKPVLSGIWNLHNSNNNIDLTSGIRNDGDYIWLWAQKISLNKINKINFNINSDILYIGKITHISSHYFFSEDSPSTGNENILKLAYKINGTIIHGYENEPEMSEKFYMTRWWA